MADEAPGEAAPLAGREGGVGVQPDKGVPRSSTVGRDEAEGIQVGGEGVEGRQGGEGDMDLDDVCYR